MCQARKKNKQTPPGTIKKSDTPQATHHLEREENTMRREQRLGAYCLFSFDSPLRFASVLIIRVLINFMCMLFLRNLSKIVHHSTYRALDELRMRYYEGRSWTKCSTRRFGMAFLRFVVSSCRFVVSLWRFVVSAHRYS